MSNTRVHRPTADSQNMNAASQVIAIVFYCFDKPSRWPTSDLTTYWITHRASQHHCGLHRMWSVRKVGQGCNASLLSKSFHNTRSHRYRHTQFPMSEHYVVFVLKKYVTQKSPNICNRHLLSCQHFSNHYFSERHQLNFLRTKFYLIQRIDKSVLI